MPDASVVEEQFVTEIAKILSESPYQPYAVGFSEPLNEQFRLMRGWPVDQQLVKDLNAVPTVTNVTVFSQPGQRNTTRFLRQMMIQTVEVPTPTMIGELLSSTQVRFVGVGSAKEVISVAYGGQHGAAVRLTDQDTPQTVAAYFASALPNATATDDTLTLTTFLPVSVAFGMDVRSLREVHRQCGIWRVTVWAVTPQLRDQFCSLIDPALQGLDRFFFPDGSCSGPVVGAGFAVIDVTQKEKLWKRDLLYEVEYPTDVTEIAPVMVLGDGFLNDHEFFSEPFIAPTTFVDANATVSNTALGL
jgi:hypothetical protein